MIGQLTVDLFGRPIGRLAINEPSPSPEDWTFTYLSAYLDSRAPVPLSVSMALRGEPHAGAVARNWFCNLLPEGAVREAVTTRLRIAANDDFALLAAIGGECAGAVSIYDPENPTENIEGSGETDVATLLEGAQIGEGAWALLGTPLRLSLAGAQDKIPVIAQPDGRLRLPTPGESSTHILKPDSRRFPGLRDLEALGSALARAIGLAAAHSRPVKVAEHSALLIERYDRQLIAGDATRRLHQEDFCQALGYPGELKYESQGGPRLAACSKLVRQLGLGPAAVQGLLDWAIFNALIGNADAHAKNLALLRDLDGRLKLAPFYDLVPTLALPERLVDRTPALRIGTAQRIDQISADDWRMFARDAGYAPRFVLNRVAELAGGIGEKLLPTGTSLIEQGSNADRIRSAIEVIGKNVERVGEGASR